MDVAKHPLKICGGPQDDCQRISIRILFTDNDVNIMSFME